MFSLLKPSPSGHEQNENEKLKEEAAKFLDPDASSQEMTELQEEFTKRLGVAERTVSSVLLRSSYLQSPYHILALISMTCYLVPTL